MFCELNFLGDFSGKTCFSTIEMRKQHSVSWNEVVRKFWQRKKNNIKTFLLNVLYSFSKHDFFSVEKEIAKNHKKRKKKFFFKWIIFQKTFVASVLSCFSWKKKEKEFCSNTKKLSKAQTLVFAHKKNTDFHHKCIYFFESVTKWREKVKLEEFFFLSKQKKKNLSDGKKKLKKKCLLPKHFSHNKGIKHFSINYIWFYFWSFFCVKPSGKKRV